MTSMTQDRIDLSSLAASLLFHLLVLMLIASGIFSQRAQQVALITDVTLIDIKNATGLKGDEKNTAGLEQKQKKLPEVIKKQEEKKITKKAAYAKVVDIKEKLRKIEEKKSALDLGVSKEKLRSISEDTKVSEGIDSETYNAEEAAAGSEPSISGDIATRKYKKIEWQFPKKLPEETELAVEVTVLPSGIISSVKLARTSGYPELDRMALSQARKLEFEPLPGNAQALDSTGILLFKFGAKQ